MSQVTTEFRRAALRRGVLVKPTGKCAEEAPEKVRYAAVMEFANLGFMVEPSDLAGISTSFLETVLHDARVVIGDDRPMKPIYPGFPKQVEDLPIIQRLVEQLLHYYTAGAYLPNYPTEARPGLPLEEMVARARVLQVVPASKAALEFQEELVTNPVAEAEGDRALLRGAVALARPTLAGLKATFSKATHSENKVYYLITVCETEAYSTEELITTLAPTCRTADDLLRLVLGAAGKASDPKYYTNFEKAVTHLGNKHLQAVAMGRLNRATRRSIVESLGKVTGGFMADRLVRRQGYWRRVMRAVHPYDLKLSPEAKRACDIIHSNGNYRTLNSLVEEALEKGEVAKATTLLEDHNPGELLRTLVSLSRSITKLDDAKKVAASVRKVGSKAKTPVLVSAYNGVLSANDTHARLNRVAGLNNTILVREVKPVPQDYLDLLLEALKDALKVRLAEQDAPTGPVGVVGSSPVPLVRRDASISDRVLARGQELSPVGEGTNLRLFAHWRNTGHYESGYMDIGVVVLDKDFQYITSCSWNNWVNAHQWATYSGDKLVDPGEDAAEFIDVRPKNLRKAYPNSKWVALTINSWNGWPMNTVDIVAGVMYRKDRNAGEVFDPRTVETCFKPTTEATQAVPLVVNLSTGAMVWLDTSNGSTRKHQSASDDFSVGPLVYDELARPRLTMGDLARLWAEAHNASTEEREVDTAQVLSLLG